MSPAFPPPVSQRASLPALVTNRCSVIGREKGGGSVADLRRFLWCWRKWNVSSWRSLLGGGGVVGPVLYSILSNSAAVRNIVITSSWGRAVRWYSGYSEMIQWMIQWMMGIGPAVRQVVSGCWWSFVGSAAKSLKLTVVVAEFRFLGDWCSGVLKSFTLWGVLFCGFGEELLAAD